MQVFQRRQDGSVDFYRNWTEYASGFGDVEGEFWLGNENIHSLTTQAGKTYELRVDLDDGTETRLAVYDSFYIAGPDDNYRLHLGQYNPLSNAGKGYSFCCFKLSLLFPASETQLKLKGVIRQ